MSNNELHEKVVYCNNCELVYTAYIEEDDYWYATTMAGWRNLDLIIIACPYCDQVVNESVNKFYMPKSREYL